MRRIPIMEKEKKGDYLLVDDAEGVVALVQMGSLEIHLWGATERDLERPDRLVFDLDPAEGVPWARTVQAARRLRERLDALGLESFVKTTGGKGLHVVAPVEPVLDWDAVKTFAKAMAAALVEGHPGEYVDQAGKALRHGKIFIDYLRNGRGATSVAPYSTRAKSGAPVSTPVRWEELDAAKPGAFTMATVPARLARLKKDPWEGFFDLKQRLPAEIERSLAKV
jgi:bifunctional non-homologous end joining protein LigD